VFKDLAGALVIEAAVCLARETPTIALKKGLSSGKSKEEARTNYYEQM
jgi:hypothetical protein